MWGMFAAFWQCFPTAMKSFLAPLLAAAYLPLKRQGIALRERWFTSIGIALVNGEWCLHCVCSSRYIFQPRLQGCGILSPLVFSQKGLTLCCKSKMPFERRLCLFLFIRHNQRATRLLGVRCEKSTGNLLEKTCASFPVIIPCSFFANFPSEGFSTSCFISCIIRSLSFQQQIASDCHLLCACSLSVCFAAVSLFLWWHFGGGSKSFWSGLSSATAKTFTHGLAVGCFMCVAESVWPKVCYRFGLIHATDPPTPLSLRKLRAESHHKLCPDCLYSI